MTTCFITLGLLLVFSVNARAQREKEERVLRYETAIYTNEKLKWEEVVKVENSYQKVLTTVEPVNNFYTPVRNTRACDVLTYNLSPVRRSVLATLKLKVGLRLAWQGKSLAFSTTKSGDFAERGITFSFF
jgi:hypothetical protein